MSTKKADKVTVGELRSAAKWFRGVMGLTDWAISVTFVARAPLWVEFKQERLSRATGGVNICPKQKAASVWVKRLQPGDKAAYLVTLFHELVHVQLECIDPFGRLGTLAGEFTVDRLAGQIATAYLSSC